MITFIVPYKKDNSEREINLKMVRTYYSRLFPGAQFLMQEAHGETFEKSALYNSGVIHAEHDVICFLDCDVIVSKESIEKSIKLAQDKDNVIIGYNGVAIYLSLEAKYRLLENPGWHISHELSYQQLMEFLPNTEYIPKLHDSNELYNIANTRAVGGCLIMSKECFKDINGFNPNFKNWGYEDTEIVLRASKLGKNVVMVNTDNPYLFHLPHDDDKAPRSAHSFYAANEREYNKIAAMSSDAIRQYIETWKV
jgi:predicted glycosyltransferase involved in capsule biosynthesis